MGDMMTFPAFVDEFMERYKMTDTEHVYSNGTEYVPIYRMKQWFEHCRHQQFQAADVVTVRHGRWNDSLARIAPYCSACGHSHRCLIRTPNYCPNCGAKMDKEEYND